MRANVLEDVRTKYSNSLYHSPEVIREYPNTRNAPPGFIGAPNIDYRSEKQIEGSFIRDADMHSCDDCGVVFADTHDLQRHVKTWCPEGKKRKAEDSHEEEPPRKTPPLPWISVDEVPSTNEEIDYLDDVRQYFEPLANEAGRKTEDAWREKLGEYKAEGLTEKKARSKAFKFTFDEDKREFMRLYSTFLLTAVQLDDSLVHKKILKEVVESEIENPKKTIRRVLKKYSHWFDDLILNQSDDDTESDVSTDHDE
ncbi:hypothetical protein ACF0H5_007013 [Mactra antiquata]